MIKFSGTWETPNQETIFIEVGDVKCIPFVLLSKCRGEECFSLYRKVAPLREDRLRFSAHCPMCVFAPLTFSFHLRRPLHSPFLVHESFVIAASSASPTQSCHKKISLYSYIEGVPEVFANFVRLYIHKSKDLALVPNWRSHSEVFDRLFKRLILNFF
jgi:hypothetical protein